ncbi:MAG: type 4a pilus biogenesis protein PilO [Vicinamibacteria bacterium]|nr:type 4a pilus biogenesis protein PilO [Vicinamibacteria bacterium]
MPDSSLSRLSVPQQLVLSIVLAVLILGAFWYFKWNPMVREEQQKTATLTNLQNEIRQLEVTASKLQEFQREVALLEQRLETLKRVLPAQKETDDLIRKINNLASESSLKIKVFSPQAVASREFYLEYPIELRVEGTYHNLAMFFDRISRLSRLVNASGLKINAARSQTAFVTIDASCTATTFVYQENAGAGAAARAGQAGAAR